jgi:NAD(P)-dependent dehydrogenase (short-subunit alcohol dehydrogenase family)
VLVTGATDGLGRRVAERLAAPGRRLLLHGRDHARGAAVLEAVESGGATGVFLAADLASLSDVAGLAERVRAEVDHLDLLVNNAGIARVDAPRAVSADGHELHLAVNYLAPALLTRLLLPVMGGQRHSRVVNITSAGQSSIDFDDLMLATYDGYRAYGQSKLADVMLTFDLAEELAGSGVTVDCLHPATHMDTGPVRAAGIHPHSSVDDGAAATVALALESRGTGRYFDGRRESRAMSQAYDDSARRRLRAVTDELLAPWLPSTR